MGARPPRRCCCCTPQSLGRSRTPHRVRHPHRESPQKESPQKESPQKESPQKESTQKNETHRQHSKQANKNNPLRLLYQMPSNKQPCMFRYTRLFQHQKEWTRCALRRLTRCAGWLIRLCAPQFNDNISTYQRMTHCAAIARSQATLPTPRDCHITFAHYFSAGNHVVDSHRDRVRVVRVGAREHVPSLGDVTDMRVRSVV